MTVVESRSALVWAYPVRVILLIVAIILEVLAAFSVSVPLELQPLGIAFFAAAFVVP